MGVSPHPLTMAGYETERMMYFKKQQRENIDTLLDTINPDFTATYSTTGKVTIDLPLTDQDTINLAEAGIFTPLKTDAIAIWDALGTSRTDLPADIEYYVVWVDGQPIARFEIYPDMNRVEFNKRVQDNPRKREKRWVSPRQDIMVKIISDIGDGGTEAEIEEAILIAVIEQYIGKDPLRAALIMKEQIINLSNGGINATIRERQPLRRQEKRKTSGEKRESQTSLVPVH